MPAPSGWRRFLPLLLPLIPAALAPGFLGSDAPAFLAWWLALTVFGLAVLPLSARLFQPSPDRGFLFAKPLALLVTAVAVFILSSLRLAPFRMPVILVLLAIFSLCVHAPAASRAFWRTATADPAVLAFWGAEETVFGLASLYWTYARGLHPALDSLEKFMDYGFMMSLWRTDWLPAADMWMAGKSINYYYFGQFAATLWAKACGVPPAQAYNLAMGSMFALTLCLGFAVALLLGAIFRRSFRHASRFLPATYAAAAAVLLTLGGNGHIFYYGGSAIGKSLHGFFKGIGLTVGDLPVNYWFADATRYIGYNPETADKTIHEFPFYSFLVADLHAHVVSLLPVLLTLGLLAVLILRPLGPAHTLARAWSRSAEPIALTGRPRTPGLLEGGGRQAAAELRRRLRQAAGDALPEPHLLLIAVMLAIFMMGNYWDFVIYMGVTACVLVLRPQLQPAAATTGRALLLALAGLILLAVPFLAVGNVFLAVAAYAAAATAGRFIERRWTHPLTVAVARLGELFVLSHLIALPFNNGFEPISKTIARTVNRTPLIQLWILYGFFLLAGIAFAMDLARQRRSAEIRAISRFQPEPPAAEAAGRGSRFLPGLMDLSPADRLLLVFLVCGFGLILLPELVYVVDIYSGDFKRANTMFKFTYQAFILLSFVLAWAPLRLLLHTDTAAAGPGQPRPIEDATQRTRRRRAMGFILLLLFVPSLMYPVNVTGQWLGSFARKNYKGLDGVRLFAEKDSPSIAGSKTGELADDYAAVNWFNTHVTGQPVILESFGDSYTDYCRISAYTGLPTVIGWQTHEWLWRTSKATPEAYGSVVVPRQNDVRTMYTSTDPAQAMRLFEKYNVRYIVIGDLERQKFSATDASGKPSTAVNEGFLRSLGTVAFQSGTLVVIERA